MSFKHSPVSQDVLNKLISLVINRTTTNSHVTLAYFRGAGKPFELRYLLSNFSDVPGNNTNRIYIWIDLKIFAQDPSAALKDSLTFILSNFEKNLTSEAIERIPKLVSVDNLTISDYVSFITNSLLKGDLSITFIFEHFDASYFPIGNPLLVNTVNLLRKINLNKVSCIFLSGAEFTETNLAILGDLRDQFLANIVWGNNLVFDSTCIAQTLENFRDLYKKDFTSEFRDALVSLAYGDPTLVRRILMLAVNDANFENAFIMHQTDLSYIVGLIDQSWFEKRYTELLFNLSEESVLKLKNGDFENLSEYVRKCGILVENTNTAFSFFNPLFSFYALKTLPSLFKDKKLFSNKLILPPEKYLSAQEMLLLNYLEKNSHSIVSRDAIAQALWGEIWEEKFSDWALDKLISTLRKKLSSNSYPKSIRTLKGRGIILS